MDEKIKQLAASAHDKGERYQLRDFAEYGLDDELCGNDKLPDGKTCIQCANYDHGLKCHQKIGVCCENTLCQWSESRFMPHNM